MGMSYSFSAPAWDPLSLPGKFFCDKMQIIGNTFTEDSHTCSWILLHGGILYFRGHF